uniref:Gag protein n=1 Tax=Macrostomum lignano TaxID=282301 RepID=A0A1I8GUN4_9PLAT
TRQLDSKSACITHHLCILVQGEAELYHPIAQEPPLRDGGCRFGHLSGRHRRGFFGIIKSSSVIKGAQELLSRCSGCHGSRRRRFVLIRASPPQLGGKGAAQNPIRAGLQRQLRHRPRQQPSAAAAAAAAAGHRQEEVRDQLQQFAEFFQHSKKQKSLRVQVEPRL